jgi:hypothetical protein
VGAAVCEAVACGLVVIGDWPDAPAALGVPVIFSAFVYQTVLFLKSRRDLNKTSLLGKSRRKGGPVYDYRQRPERTSLDRSKKTSS